MIPIQVGFFLRKNSELDQEPEGWKGSLEVEIFHPLVIEFLNAFKASTSTFKSISAERIPNRQVKHMKTANATLRNTIASRDTIDIAYIASVWIFT